MAGFHKYKSKKENIEPFASSERPIPRCCSVATMAEAADGLIDSLMATARMLVSLTARSLAQLDANVTLPQYRALVILAGSGPRRLVDLAAELSVQPSTATRMCDRLARKGFVTREERADDRRVAWVVLKPAGRELVGAMMQRRRADIEELVGSVTLPDPAGLAAALRALTTAAGELPESDWQANWRVQPAAR
jgi:DNA-binding MarR family transcriptional regulator